MTQLPLPHNYDGIQEFDNPLPRWWVYLFYLTIIFGVLYCAYYWAGPGKTLSQEFEADFQRMKGNAAVVVVSKKTEDLEKMAHDPAVLAKGKAIFQSKCAACHNADGQGLIGPNLTDKFWIHGKGTFTDIRDVIAKGVPEKGMLSWEALMKPEDIDAAAAYVLSLKGTHPANPKPPQGNSVE